MLPGLPYIQLRLYEHQGKGHTIAADGFRLGDDIRHYPGPLEGEEPACSGTAHLHVVHDEQDVVPVAELPKPSQPLGGHGVYAAVGLGGLQDEGGGLFHAGMVVGEKRLDIFQRVQLREHIGRGHMGHVLQWHARPGPAGRVCSQRDASKGHAVEGPHQGEYPRTALRLPGQL